MSQPTKEEMRQQMLAALAEADGKGPLAQPVIPPGAKAVLLQRGPNGMQHRVVTAAEAGLAVCPHDNNQAEVHVRKEINFGKPEFSAEVVIRCTDCGRRYLFPDGKDRLFAAIVPEG